MAIAFIADNATPTYANRTNTTITRPAGSDGTSLKVALVATDDQAVTTNANWTQFTGSPLTYSGTIRMYLYYTFHDAASWTFNHNSDGSHGYCMAFSGVDTTTPIDVQPTTNSGSSTTATGTGLTTLTAGAMLVLILDAGAVMTSSSTPTGMTEDEDIGADSKAGYHQIIAAAGATGNRASTLNPSAPWGAMMFALKPAGATSTRSGLVLPSLVASPLVIPRLAY